MTVAAPVVQGKKGEKKAPEKARSRSSASLHAGDARKQCQALLRWYDRHRRALPWRALPGENADPYRVWLSEIMLQQTTVKAVAPYFARFTARWPTVRALALAPLDDVLKLWAGLGYYARARNLHACARMVVERHGGDFPQSAAELGMLPGIGPYSGAAIAAIAFSARAAAIDGNAERVLARYFAVEDSLPAARPSIRRLAENLLPPARCGDFAQALMDLGATVCTPKKPACIMCPWSPGCLARRRGDPAAFPRKTPKRQGDLRSGAAFVLNREDGAILLRTRAQSGLLARMAEVPTTEWTPNFNHRDALFQAPRPACARPKWRRIPGHVVHAFTHFPLRLMVFAATVGVRTPAPAGMRWVAKERIAGEALPSIMRKVLAHALQFDRIAGNSTGVSTPAQQAKRRVK
jgi:A/G-specific adenine glycosylase